MYVTSCSVRKKLDATVASLLTGFVRDEDFSDSMSEFYSIYCDGWSSRQERYTMIATNLS
jgi:hypothetical protein